MTSEDLEVEYLQVRKSYFQLIRNEEHINNMTTSCRHALSYRFLKSFINNTKKDDMILSVIQYWHEEFLIVFLDQ